MNLLDAVTADIPRLYTERHAWLMYGLVRWLRPEHVLEVGAFHGFCTVHLAQACKDNGLGSVTVIDDYSLGNGAAQIHNNLARAGLSDLVRLIDGKSDAVQWPRRVDFAFIDGDHSLDGCLGDCNRAIAAGATCVCVHDTSAWWGPRDYLEEFRKSAGGTWDAVEAGFDCGFAALVKRPEKGPLVYSQKDCPSGRV